MSYVHNKQYAVWLQLSCVQGLHLVMRIWTFPKREVREGRREGRIMVRYNEDAEVVARIKEGLKKKNGYCPCRLEMTEDNKCMCKEFREQIADPCFRRLLPLHVILQNQRLIRDIFSQNVLRYKTKALALSASAHNYYSSY